MPNELGTLPEWCRKEWQRLFSKWEAQPKRAFLHSGHDVFASKCHPLQRRSELLAMTKLANTISPKVVLEIGASRGGGLWAWASTLFGRPNTIQRIASYEINGFPYEDLFRQHCPQIDWCLQHDSSLNPDAREHLKLWLNGDTIDVLFIDGQKTGGAFSKDFDNHIHLMSPNGLVFMHDITSTATKDWKAIEDRFKTARIIDTSESLAAVQRERNGTPATTDYEKWLRHWKGRGAGVGVVFLGETK